MIEVSDARLVPTATLKDLNIGDTFMYEGILYMLCSQAGKNSGDDMVRVVGISGSVGMFALIPSIAKVEQVSLLIRILNL